MHPRNMYRSVAAPEFEALGEKFPDFKEYVLSKKNGKYGIDFEDPAAVRILTTVLLKNDFNIDIEIPPKKSILRTVPQSLNYILWMEGLLAKLPKTVPVKGVDVGTGPCCIFSLLGHRKNGWHFMATEIDEKSVKWGEKNIKKNNLQDFIRIVKASKETILRRVLQPWYGTFDFCVCNPPFFEDFKDQGKNKLPGNIVDSGEVAFVKKIIDDSMRFKDNIRIYSSMLRKNKSLQAIKHVLSKIKGVNFTTTCFPRSKPARWAVAWTFLPIPDFNPVQHSSMQTHMNLGSISDTTPPPPNFGQSNDIKTLKEEIFILVLRLAEKSTEVSSLKDEISDLQLQLQEAVKQKEEFSELAFIKDRKKRNTKQKRKKNKRKKPLKHLSFKIFDASTPIRDMITKITSILDDFQISYQDMYVSKPMVHVLKTKAHVLKTRAHFQIKAFQNTWTGQQCKRRELERKLKEISFGTEGGNDRPDDVTIKSEDKHDVEFSMATTDYTESRKRKAEYDDQTDRPHKHLKMDAEEDRSESTVSNLVKSELDTYSAPPLLNCNINLIKIADYFIFQMSCISDSVADTMYEVFQQFQNELQAPAKK